MLKNVTVTIEEDVLRWVRREAARENSSVSRYLGNLLKKDMMERDDYWRAYRLWKSLRPIEAFDASDRLTREEAHERR